MTEDEILQSALKNPNIAKPWKKIKQIYLKYMETGIQKNFFEKYIDPYAQSQDKRYYVYVTKIIELVLNNEKDSNIKCTMTIMLEIYEKLFHRSGNNKISIIRVSSTQPTPTPDKKIEVISNQAQNFFDEELELSSELAKKSKILMQNLEKIVEAKKDAEHLTNDLLPLLRNQETWEDAYKAINWLAIHGTPGEDSNGKPYGRNLALKILDNIFAKLSKELSQEEELFSAAYEDSTNINAWKELKDRFDDFISQNYPIDTTVQNYIWPKFQVVDKKTYIFLVKIMDMLPPYLNPIAYSSLQNDFKQYCADCAKEPWFAEISSTPARKISLPLKKIAELPALIEAGKGVAYIEKILAPKIVDEPEIKECIEQLEWFSNQEINDVIKEKAKSVLRKILTGPTDLKTIDFKKNYATSVYQDALAASHRAQTAADAAAKSAASANHIVKKMNEQIAEKNKLAKLLRKSTHTKIFENLSTIKTQAIIEFKEAIARKALDREKADKKMREEYEKKRIARELNKLQPSDADEKIFFNTNEQPELQPVNINSVDIHTKKEKKRLKKIVKIKARKEIIAFNEAREKEAEEKLLELTAQTSKNNHTETNNEKLPPSSALIQENTVASEIKTPPSEFKKSSNLNPLSVPFSPKKELEEHGSIELTQEDIPSFLLQIAKYLKKVTGQDIYLAGSTVPNIYLSKKHQTELKINDSDLKIVQEKGQGLSLEELYRIFEELKSKGKISKCKIIYGKFPLIKVRLNNGEKIEIAIWYKDNKNQTTDQAIINKLNNGHSDFNISALFLNLNADKPKILGSKKNIETFLNNRISLVNTEPSIFKKDPRCLLRLVMKEEYYSQFDYKLDDTLEMLIQSDLPVQSFDQLKIDTSKQKQMLTFLQKNLLARYDIEQSIKLLHKQHGIFAALSNVDINFKNLQQPIFPETFVKYYQGSRTYTKLIAFCSLLLAYKCAEVLSTYKDNHSLARNKLENWSFYPIIKQIDNIYPYKKGLFLLHRVKEEMFNKNITIVDHTVFASLSRIVQPRLYKKTNSTLADFNHHQLSYHGVSSTLFSNNVATPSETVRVTFKAFSPSIA